MLILGQNYFRNSCKFAYKCKHKYSLVVDTQKQLAGEQCLAVLAYLKNFILITTLLQLFGQVAQKITARGTPVVFLIEADSGVHLSKMLGQLLN